MQRHYYAIVAERCGVRVIMRSERNVAEVGDLAAIRQPYIPGTRSSQSHALFCAEPVRTIS